MVHSDFLKLSVTLVLLVATAFVSVAAVAADDSGTIRLVKPARTSPALGGTADDWYGQGLSPAKAGGATVASDWFERHPESIYSVSAAVASDWFERHPESIYSGSAAGGYMFGAIRQLINLGASAGAQRHYGPPGR